MKIPFISVPDTPLASSTQDHVPIAEITDDMILFKDGGASIILESTALNFGLLSEREQEAVIAAYAALLNSLSFAIQIVVRSQRKDISNYIKYLDEYYKKAPNPKLANLMLSYRSFITDTVKKKNVLGKMFYITIPFSPLELGVTKSFLSVTSTSQTLPFPKSYVLKKAKIILYPRRDHIVRQMARLGLKVRQLSTNEITELFFGLYNQEPPLSSKQLADNLEEEKRK